MFGSQLVNEQATWEDILAVLEVMEKGRWTSVYAYDHFIPPCLLYTSPSPRD